MVAGQKGVAGGCGLQRGQQSFTRLPLAVAEIHSGGNGAGTRQHEAHIRVRGQAGQVVGRITSAGHWRDFQRARILQQAVRKGLDHAELDPVKHQQRREHGGQSQHGTGRQQAFMGIISERQQAGAGDCPHTLTPSRLYGAHRPQRRRDRIPRQSGPG